MSTKYLFGREDVYVFNLKRGEKGETFARHGACYLHAPKTEAHAEWNWFGRHGFGLGFELGRNGMESDIGLSLYFGRVGSLWLRARMPFTKWLRVRDHEKKNWYEARHYGLKLFPYNGCLFRAQFGAYDGMGREARRWRECSLQQWKIIGRTKCDTEVTAEGECHIPMPEGNYVGKWKKEQRTWRHITRRGRLWDRIFGVTIRTSVDLDIEGGIPVEGKGENSWDCGMDGIFGVSGNTVEDAIANAVRACLRDRQRYGGPHNLPRPMTVAHRHAHHRVPPMALARRSTRRMHPPTTPRNRTA